MNLDDGAFRKISVLSKEHINGRNRNTSVYVHSKARMLKTLMSKRKKTETDLGYSPLDLGYNSSFTTGFKSFEIPALELNSKIEEESIKKECLNSSITQESLCTTKPQSDEIPEYQNVESTPIKPIQAEIQKSENQDIKRFATNSSIKKYTNRWLNTILENQSIKLNMLATPRTTNRDLDKYSINLPLAQGFVQSAAARRGRDRGMESGCCNRCSVF